MSDVNDYLRQSTGEEADATAEQVEQFLHDPYLQPVEGGYYQCTLCSATLPGAHHVSMHIQGKTHKRKLSNFSTHPNEPGYLEQYGRQFFDGEIELTFGVIGKEEAPAHFAEELRCELCESSLYGWDQWHTHFIGKKHVKSRRNSPNRLMWQCLHADFPYYFEHISGLWQSTPPKHGHTVREGKLIVLPPHSS